ncbi:WD40 repeat domain-containing protein, partial [Nocardiopsis tropica]
QRPTPGQILARFEEHDLEVSWPPPAGSDLPVPEQPPAAPATPPTLKEGAGLKRKTPLLIAGAGTAAVVLIGGLILWNPLGFALPLITEPVVLAEAWAAESVAFSPDGRTLAAGGLSGDIRLWDVRTGEHILSMSGYESGVDSLAFHPDGTTLASSSFGTETDPVRLWDVATGEWERSLSVEGWEDSDMPTNDVAFHPTGNLIVTAQATGAHLWDSEAAEPIAGFTAEEEEGLSISPRSSAFSPDGALLATGTNDNMVLLWEVDTTELVATLTGHTNPVTAVAFSPDGSTLASGGDEESARLWDVRTGNQSAVLETASSRSLSFHPDGSLLATGGFREAQVWNIETGERVAISDSADFTGEVAFSPDGSGLATADSGVYLWPMD